MDKYEELSTKAKEKQKSKPENQGIVLQLSWCSTAVGAKEIIERIDKVAKKLGIDSIVTRSVGCKGFCSQEPTLEVTIPGQETMMYSLVTADKAERILIDYYNKILAQKSESE